MYFIMQRSWKLDVILLSYSTVLYRFHISYYCVKKWLLLMQLDGDDDVWWCFWYCIAKMMYYCLWYMDAFCNMKPSYNSDYFLLYLEKYFFMIISYCKDHKKVLLPLIPNHYQLDHSNFSWIFAITLMKLSFTGIE